MLIRNTLGAYRAPLDPTDGAMLGAAGAEEVGRFLAHRDRYASTPLLSLPALADELRVGAIYIKDEGQRLGLGSFKALGGAYAVVRLAVERAAERLGRPMDVAEWQNPLVTEAAANMTIACATDGNHGRSVAQGAQLIGAACIIFVHAGVSEERTRAIAALNAKVVRVEGNYDDSVAEASRQAAAKGWVMVSDTSWPGYERIPHLVMQGYTAMLREAVAVLPDAPTHVFIQAGVGGVAAAVSAYFAQVYGGRRPFVTVVEPSRAACLFESARAGHPVKLDQEKSTVMAMLECFEPSLVAWRILSRVADAFMTVEDEQAIDAMNCLARPSGTDPAIVAGESGGVGLAGLIGVADDPISRNAIALSNSSRIFLINTEGATDPLLYKMLTGLTSVEALERRTHDARC
ncbi:MAG: diaminopropionate ammonia-lyase [Acidobacteriaceae bacterium]